MTAQRSTGGRRKGGVDTASSLTKSTSHYQRAPDMADLAALDATAIASEAVGTPVAWSAKVLGAMEAFQIPRALERKQKLQPRPRSLVRDQSVTLIELLKQGKTQDAARHLLVGEPGCGKSTYLLQALAHALEDGWAVVYIPRTIDMVNSSSPYVYSSVLQTYLQPEITNALLTAIGKVNNEVLKKLKSIAPLTVEGHELFPKHTSLTTLVSKVLAEHTNPLARQLALELVFNTLAQQTEVPVLVAIDDVQALFAPSQYRDADFTQLQSYELAVPRSLLSLFLTSKKGIQRGALLATVGMAHSEYPAPAPLLAAVRAASSRRDAAVPWARILQTFSSPTSPTRVEEPHAYTPMDAQHLQNATDAHFAPLDVGARLTRAEASSLLDLMRREQVLWSPPNDELFVSKLMESNGNICVFERSWRATLV
ncbi:Rsm23p [Malassezia vespertilionis]|uniref:Small ribosomal subunit protein mS29 n=2 Tax=Malassezia vespertilionis TaxID=2020962 RepID=A0A2N1JGU4_9BASI|nr:Rsm23p [Malassezia vespertilionis]